MTQRKKGINENNTVKTLPDTQVIALAVRKRQIDVPIQRYTLEQDVLTLYLYGGRVETFYLADLLP